MWKSGFVGCEHVFSFRCSGEVVNLLRAAERYGILMEKAGARIETICRRCRDFSGVGRQWEPEKADANAA